MKNKTNTNGGALPRRRYEAKNSPLIMDIFARIADQRTLENAQVAEGAIKWNGSTLMVSDWIKLVELNSRQLDVSEAVEKLGQCYDQERGNDALRHVLGEKLVRIAAHCVAWLEALEIQKRKPETGDLKPETGNLKPETGNLKPERRKLRPLTEEQIDTVLHGRSV